MYRPLILPDIKGRAKYSTLLNYYLGVFKILDTIDTKKAERINTHIKRIMGAATRMRLIRPAQPIKKGK